MIHLKSFTGFSHVRNSGNASRRRVVCLVHQITAFTAVFGIQGNIRAITRNNHFLQLRRCTGAGRIAGERNCSAVFSNGKLFDICFDALTFLICSRSFFSRASCLHLKPGDGRIGGGTRDDRLKVLADLTRCPKSPKVSALF